MKHFLFIVMAIAIAASVDAAGVGVSISVGQPGFYGHIDIGDFPEPELIYPRPVVIVPAPRGVVPQPLYLHVPPGHEKNWKKHCRKYNACGRPVYFVRNQWYQKVYVPEYQARHRHDDRGRGGYRDGGHEDRGNHGQGRGHGKGQSRDHGRD